MSWLTKGPLGKLWDKTLGGGGVGGQILDITGLGQSHQTKNFLTNERNKLGSYIGGVEKREQPIRNYYSALGSMYRNEATQKAANVDYGARTTGDTITSQKSNKMSMMNIVSHGEVDRQSGQAMDASNFQWGSNRAALDKSFSMQTLQSDRAQSTELQNLSDMLYQLNQQKANI